jgi:hypothetical protein
MTRADLIARFMTSSIVSEYDTEATRDEVWSMVRDGLATVRGLYTGCMAVTLTEAGRALASEAEGSTDET